MLNGIQVRGIGWKKLQGMSGIGDSLLSVLSFVESGVVPHDDGFGRQLRDEIFYYPCLKDVAVDVARTERYGE